MLEAFGVPGVKLTSQWKCISNLFDLSLSEIAGMYVTVYTMGALQKLLNIYLLSLQYQLTL